LCTSRSGKNTFFCIFSAFHSVFKRAKIIYTSVSFKESFEIHEFNFVGKYYITRVTIVFFAKIRNLFTRTRYMYEILYLEITRPFFPFERSRETGKHFLQNIYRQEQTRRILKNFLLKVCVLYNGRHLMRWSGFSFSPSYLLFGARSRCGAS